jgi:glutaredoxin-like protein NrdH
MEMTHMEGKNRGKVILYAISTCVWCKRTKRLLGHLGVEYSYIDVDLLSGNEKEEVLTEVRKHNPSCTFPTIVIDDKKCIRGYKENEIKEALEE